MKTLLSVIVVGALAMSALAIPQTFNNGFFGAVGQQLDDAIAQVAAFGPGVEPRGQWAPIAGKPEVLRLQQTAVAFGVPASEVTAERSNNAIAKYRIIYAAAEDRKRGKQASSLEARVLAGVSAFTGASASTSEPLTHRGVKIAVLRGKGGDVIVEITRTS